MKRLLYTTLLVLSTGIIASCDKMGEDLTLATNSLTGKTWRITQAAYAFNGEVVHIKDASEYYYYDGEYIQSIYCYLGNITAYGTSDYDENVHAIMVAPYSINNDIVYVGIDGFVRAFKFVQRSEKSITVQYWSWYLTRGYTRNEWGEEIGTYKGCKIYAPARGDTWEAIYETYLAQDGNHYECRVVYKEDSNEIDYCYDAYQLTLELEQ